jgi:hypothetical protein
LSTVRRVAGPTLTLLYDPDSPYAGSISDFVLFYGRSPEGKETRQSRAVDQTLQELKARNLGLRIHREPWDGDDCSSPPLAAGKNEPSG